MKNAKGGLGMTCTHEEKSGEWKTRKAMSLSQFGSGKQRLRQRFIDPLRRERELLKALTSGSHIDMPKEKGKVVSR